MSERLPDSQEKAPRRRRYAPPCVRSEGVEEGALLLCTTARPYVCEGGGCCDASPYCDYKCNGG